MIHFDMALIDGIDKSHSGMQNTISSKHQKNQRHPRSTLLD